MNGQALILLKPESKGCIVLLRQCARAARRNRECITLVSLACLSLIRCTATSASRPTSVSSSTPFDHFDRSVRVAHKRAEVPPYRRLQRGIGVERVDGQKCAEL